MTHKCLKHDFIFSVPNLLLKRNVITKKYISRLHFLHFPVIFFFIYLFLSFILIFSPFKKLNIYLFYFKCGKCKNVYDFFSFESLEKNILI